MNTTTNNTNESKWESILTLYSSRKSSTFSKWVRRVLDTETPWTESENRAFRSYISRYGNGKATIDQKQCLLDLFTERAIDVGYKITDSQSVKGYLYLKDTIYTKTGKLSRSKHNVFSTREIDIVNNFSEHLFTGLYPQTNGLGETIAYLPLYTCIAKNGDSFEYIGACRGIMQVVG